MQYSRPPCPQASVQAAEAHIRQPTVRLTASIRRLALVSFTLMALVATKAEAAACTWVAAGDPADSNFTGPLNWDDPPSPAADLFFAAGSAFAAKGSPVNDLVNLDLNAIYLYEAYNITGNPVVCQIIKSYNATTATVNLPVSTAGTAVLTVTVEIEGATLNLPGLLSGPGPATYAGPGIKRLSGTVNNTLSGLTSVALGNLLLDSTAAEAIAGPMVIDSGAVVTLKSAPEIKNTMTVTVDGDLDLSTATGNDGADTETIGGLLGTGTVHLGANSLGCSAQASPTVFSGGFSGTGGFHQSVSGTQVLSGTSTNTGATTLAGGSLHLRGSQPASPVSVTSGTLVLANDSLVGDVTLSGGAGSTLSCYDDLSAMTLHSTATSLTIGSGSTFEIDVRGATATSYSNLTTAAVALTGAVLSVDTVIYTPAAAAVMTIIDNTGAAAVTGTFAGLAEGALVVSATDPTTTFAISYVGGTGNDVTLRCLILDIAAPVISAVTASSIAASSAAITWTTNETSTSQVEYGLTTAYGSTTTLDASLVQSHGVPLTGLLASTTYHYRVLSRDPTGNLATGADKTFVTTALADTTEPVISAVSAGSLTTTSAVVTWTTNEASDSQVAYGLTTAYGSTTTLAPSLVRSHSVLISGLTATTVYHYHVLSADAASNSASGVDLTFTTPTTDGGGTASTSGDGGGGNCGLGGALALFAMSLLLTLRLGALERRED